MDFEKLQTFNTLCKLKNFSAAAEQLYISQPNVTKHIQRLEKEIEQELIYRKAKQFELTKAGEELYQFSENVLKEYEHLNFQLSLIRQAKDQLKLGTTNLIGNSILPNILLEFNQDYPQLRLNLQVERSKQIVNLLVTGKIDMALLSSYIKIPSEHYRRQTIFKDKLVLIVPPTHSLANHSYCSLNDLKNETFITKDENASLVKFLKMKLNDPSFLSQSTINISSQTSIKHAVAKGLGISIVSEQLIENDIKLKKLSKIDIEGYPLFRDIQLVYDATADLTPSAVLFKEHLEGLM
ncbi:LysR family transcriptional regulator [Tuanshanicoccus lijuaniae]|uniref:LysR family transcriptional regulator n=1 Tax=Aerococcaceae bacterium zg-1292 TaxID=2774330 RepID=UPI001BD86E98|nr:LysR family transcriptional regulator [Aerococcaceae bacterium zg-A91]MBS4457676.1 LysR family transcriptional regulator [Aerococcaceae bacterium zg-BR33]